jgi:hypothetical protein
MMGNVVNLYDHLSSDGKQNLLWQQYSSTLDRALSGNQTHAEHLTMNFKDGNLIEIMQNGLKELVCIVVYTWTKPEGKESDVRIAWLAKELSEPQYIPKLKEEHQPKLVADNFDQFTRTTEYASFYRAALARFGVGTDPMALARVAYAAAQLKAPVDDALLDRLMEDVKRTDGARHERLEKVMQNQGVDIRHG